MRVLVACEESQAVCKAFRELGHEAYSCDIQECSGGHPEWHIQGDVLPYIDGKCNFITQAGVFGYIEGPWDLLIAHPPCTYLSNAGAARLYRKEGGETWVKLSRFQKGLEGKRFFLRLLQAECERVCVENPIPSGVFDLPPYTQIIQPYEHGHPYSKKTCLWLKGLPELVPTQMIDGDIAPWVQASGRYDRKKHPLGGHRDPKLRSKTFPGIAKAMAEQWGGDIRKESTHDSGEI